MRCIRPTIRRRRHLAGARHTEKFCAAPLSEIVQKLRSRRYPGHQQPVPRPRGGDIEKLAFCRDDLVQLEFVCYVRYARDEREDAFVTRDDSDRAEFKALGQMHHTNKGGFPDC